MKTKLSPTWIIVCVLAALVSFVVAHLDQFLPQHSETVTAAAKSLSLELPGKPSSKPSQRALEGGGPGTATIVSASHRQLPLPLFGSGKPEGHRFLQSS